MKHCVALLAAVAVLVLAMPAQAGEGKYAKCEEDIQVCLNKHAEMLKKRGWVGLEMEFTEAGQLAITRVVPESPAAQAGFHKGDILTALNGVAHSEENKAALEKMWGEMRPGQSVTYGVSRGGKTMDLQVELASIPDTVMAQWIGQHMLMAHIDRPQEEAEATS